MTVATEPSRKTMSSLPVSLKTRLKEEDSSCSVCDIHELVFMVANELDGARPCTVSEQIVLREIASC